MDRRNDIARIAGELPRLRRYALTLTRDAERSDDLVQESALRAIGNIDRWAPGTNLRSWLMTILHNLFINDAVRRRPVLTADGELHAAAAESGKQDARDRLRDVERAIAGLSRRQRQIIWLACVEECDFRDIADRLQIPIGTVRSRLCRAREQLRRNLEAGAQPGR